MNRLHQWYCRSAHWDGVVRGALFEWTVGGLDLGSDVLEIGSGTGVATAMLADRARRLTSVDPDVEALALLRTRAPGAYTAGADATRLPFGDARFTAVAAFTMLHHVAGRSRQRQLFGEVCRVLAPGGWFIGCDIRTSLTLRLFHLGDTYAPVAPARLADELRGAGFDSVSVVTSKRYVRWAARRPC